MRLFQGISKCGIKHFRTPGPIGSDSSASPPMSYNSAFAPGPIGIKDKHMWEEKLEHSKRIHALHDLLQEIENSRNKISETEYASRTVPLQKTMPPREFVVLWAKHSTLFKRFCFFLQTYLENFQARDNQGTTDDLTGLMSRYVEGCQPSSIGHVRNLSVLPITSSARSLILQLSISACQHAYTIYKNSRTNASRKTVILRAAEAQLAAWEAGVLPPRQLVSLIEQLARDVALEGQNASEKEKANLIVALAMIEFTKKLGRRAGVVGREQEKESPPPKKQKQEKTWVEFKVVWDETGEPVPQVRLRIEGPDGIENFHTTDANGKIRIDGLERGDCIARCKLNNPLLGNTLSFVGMGEPSGAQAGSNDADGSGQQHNQPPKRTGVQQIGLIEEHKVKSGESLKSLADQAGITWQELAKFNWDTDVPKEINEHLRDEVGCTKKTADGNNYMFDDSDDPGIVFIPSKWEQMGLVTEKTHLIRVMDISCVEVAKLCFADDDYMLPNTEYIVYDRSWSEVTRGTSDDHALLELPQRFNSNWNIVCGPLYEISGRVVYGDMQTPVAGESITIQMWTDRSLDLTTGTEGQISISDVPAGTLVIQWNTLETVFFVERDNDDVTFRLKETGSVEETGEDEPDIHEQLAEILREETEKDEQEDEQEELEERNETPDDEDVETING